MTTIEILIRSVTVLALGSYLYLKHRQRLRSESWRPDEADWTGKALDTATLKPTVDRVRRNPLAARLPVFASGFRNTLIRLARQALSRLAYFQCEDLDRRGRFHHS